MATAIYFGMLMVATATSGRMPRDEAAKSQIVAHIILAVIFDICFLWRL